MRLYWGDFPDWLYWKSQLYQESQLEPEAVSRSGARGLAQFMGPTWADVSRELELAGALPSAVEPAINAGAYYMAKLRRSWKAERPSLDRHFLALASYNAGLGNILKAQVRCGGNLYQQIIACLPDVTGARSAETITYVDRIKRWREQLGERR